MDSKFKCVTPFTKDTIIYGSTEEDTSYLGYIEGYAATSHLDRYGEVISDQALFNGAADLLKHPTVFADHQYSISKAVGRVLESTFEKTEEMSGIKVKLGISKTETDLWTKSQEGIVRTFSIGGIWKDMEYGEEDGDPDIIGDLELWEMSIVGLPANPEASFGALAVKHIKSSKKESNKKEESETDKIEKIEVINMDDELKGKLAEIESKLSSLDEIEKLTKSIKDQGTSTVKLAELVSSLADNVKPILEERVERKKLAERKSALIKEQVDGFSSLPIKEQRTIQFRRVLGAILDPAVDEVVVLGKLEDDECFYDMEPEEIRKRRRECRV